MISITDFKAEKLYDGYLKMQRFSEQLPQLISRLECIKMIHEESGDLSSKIEAIKKNEGLINNSLKENKEVLDRVTKLILVIVII